jgi:hypothetical protein
MWMRYTKPAVLELPRILGRHSSRAHVPSGHILLHDPKWLNLGKAKGPSLLANRI